MRQALRIGLLLAASFASTPFAGVVQSHGALKVKGNQIVDATGSPIQVAGMSMFWSGWMGKYWNSGVVNTLADGWNSSLIRAAMGVEGNGNYLMAQAANKTMVKTVVDAAIAKDIYVIIDWHDHNATGHVNESVAFFDEMSRTYGNKPNVIFEIFNEPLKIPWTDIKSYAEKVVAAIRKNSNNLIIVGTPNWSQDVDAAAANPLADANTAYTLHFYSGSHGATLRNKANTALSKGAALFITEWGTTNADGGTVDTKVYTAESDTWLAWAREKKISWANWSVADKAEASAALKAGASSNGGWSDANLTQSGLYVKGKIKEVTAAISGGGGVVIVPPPPPVPTKIDTLAVPGRIEAEKASALSTGLQAEATTDQGGGSNLGYTSNGAWAEYTIKVASSGPYTIGARVAADAAGGGTLTFKFNNAQIGTVPVTTTGGWQTWQTKDAQVQIPSTGVGKLRVEWTGSAASLINLNWLDLQPRTASIVGASIAGDLSARRTASGLELSLPQDTRRVVVRDIHGRILSDARATGSTSFLPLSGSEVLLLEVSTDSGIRSLKVAPVR